LEIRSPLILGTDLAQIIRVRIDPQDGSTTIIGKEQGAEAAWTTHGACRIMQERNPLQLRVACPQLPIRQPDFTGTIIWRDQGRGPGLWSGFPMHRPRLDHGAIVLALLQLPEKVAEGARRMHLHPAVLDCASS
jgi:hypothetical protein